MTTDLILQKLEAQSDRLAGIEVAIAKMARQDEQISNLQKQIAILFKNYDIAFNPRDGAVTDMQKFQQSCPRWAIERTLNRQWGLILFIVTIVGGKIGGLY